MSQGTESDPDDEPIDPGETVYDEDGRVIGRVSGYTADGFEVETKESGSRSGDSEETIPGKEFGEGYLMWRCSECGEMGDLESGMPDMCPECGAPEESIYAVEED
jgi:rubrerythrin